MTTKKEDMAVSKYALMNTVSSKNQLAPNQYVEFFMNNGELKILFVGNSITRHAPKPEIGWYGDWGMAASRIENDYVHRTVSEVSKKIPVDYCIAQCSGWESNYEKGKQLLESKYAPARDFNADIVVIRLGENITNVTGNLKACFNEMIDYFKNNAKVIITNRFWGNSEINRIFYETATENGYIFCDISDLEKDKKTMALGEYEFRGVSVHPSDYGMKCISDRIVDCILKNI